MAGMFYSLEEATERLNKTEEELKEIVKDGKLREFRDGPNLLFKVDEIEALMSDTSISASEETPAPEALEPEELALETPEPEMPAPEALEPEELALETPEPEMPAPEALEPEELALETPELEMPALETPEPETPALETPELEMPALEAPEPETPALETPESEMPALETPEPETPALETPELEMPALEAPEPLEQAAETDEILLAPESGELVPPSELTDADTAITGEGISILGETDRDYQVTDDTMAETTAPPGITGTTGTTPEVPLEKIEEDVNLDSFGSGSGLLDLSLQADDTSLGGILDEIYTAEGEGQEPAEAGSAADVAAEAEQMLTEEEEFVGPQPGPEFPALAQPYIELAPDAQSNTFGMLLFLPLVVVVYTAVVTVAAQKDVMPSILPSSIQGQIWYIMIGAVVLEGLVVGAALMLSGGPAKAGKKVKKAKKLKKTKEPKKPKEVHIMEKSDKNFLLAILLCFFLGVLGAHRFYAGKTGTGLLQLFTFGGLGVWVLIDFIMIVTGKFTDKQGLPIKS
ncbi:MAG: NINE protein [Planctomycetota bacterium]|jgi:TM2 domain-containing membrane protein YozV